jgi:hypothetical protein
MIEVTWSNLVTMFATTPNTIAALFAAWIVVADFHVLLLAPSIAVSVLPV